MPPGSPPPVVAPGPVGSSPPGPQAGASKPIPRAIAPRAVGFRLMALPLHARGYYRCSREPTTGVVGVSTTRVVGGGPSGGSGRALGLAGEAQDVYAPV